MKLFHISDLHLGKRLCDYPLTEDQEYILKQIISFADIHKPDAILIAGDIYDRSIPSEEAMRLWDDFLLSLSGRKIPVLAISGNHDSEVRFSDHGRLMDSAGIYLSPVYDGSAKKVTLRDTFGEVDFWLLPFLRPVSVRRFFPEETIDDYTDACRVAIEKMGIDPERRNVLIAHQFVTGATTCESEELSVGGLDQVSAGVFDGFDYVALGHIHGKQKIGKETVRYCGTPLKYSLSEKDHQKSVTLVTIEEKGKVSVDEIPLVPKNDVRQIRGDFAQLTDPAYYNTMKTDDYIHVILTDEEDIPDAMGKLRLIYPRMTGLRYDNRRTAASAVITEARAVETKSPLELFEELYLLQNNQAMSPEQRSFLQECIGSVWEGEQHETA
ncbi:MAG: exonuclease SbcCD subunit D [Lachnospiraceae bacterium]|nr:exonuclease SbcCD subunit D [Lachnospiraceae bacterium]